MIAEAPRPLLGALVRRLMRRRLRRGLAAVRVLGLGPLRELLRERPVLLAPNHVCFWDGFLVELLSAGLGADARVLMRSDLLARTPPLRWIGCFGVRPDDARDGARAARHAARLLDRPGRAVWIFPQGRQRPQWERPLAFGPGAAAIARLAPGAALVPVSLHYELGEREQPEAWVLLGAPLPDPALLEARVDEGLALLASQIRAGTAVPGLWPEPKRMGEGAPTRLLARMIGSRTPG